MDGLKEKLNDSGGVMSRLRRTLPVLGLIVGAWSVLPPYTGPSLDTETRVEVADHVVPGVVLIVLSVTLVLLERRRSVSPTSRLVAGFVVVLSGLWMTATHVPLVAQATRGEVSAGATAYHTVPSLVVLALGLTWVSAHWDEASET
jgi:hypothetical protein